MFSSQSFHILILMYKRDVENSYLKYVIVKFEKLQCSSHFTNFPANYRALAMQNGVVMSNFILNVFKFKQENMFWQYLKLWQHEGWFYFEESIYCEASTKRFVFLYAVGLVRSYVIVILYAVR